MKSLTSTELAKALGVSAARVSQYVSEGKVDGCYIGDGRSRRFDLGKVATALGRKLDVGQMMGNGADTKRALAEITSEHQMTMAPPIPRATGGEASSLAPQDPDRYELARIQKAEEEARRLRRMNAEAEGLFVLASEVDRQVARVLGQEVREFETVLRDGARVIADRLGVDFKTTRQILVEVWRGHRALRAEVLEHQAATGAMTADEVEGNI